MADVDTNFDFDIDVLLREVEQKKSADDANKLHKIREFVTNMTFYFVFYIKYTVLMLSDTINSVSNQTKNVKITLFITFFALFIALLIVLRKIPYSEKYISLI